ncbi:hypothetical protein ABBQ32_006478 [Trebouxia sp. C0010 RCD-2024]
MASSKAPGLQREQIDKAVSALLKYVGAQKSDSKDLLEDEEYLYLNFALKKTPQPPKNPSPVRLPLPHPIYDSRNAEVCLFVKDHKGEGHKAAKLRVKQQKVAGVAKVIGVSKLKGKYEPFEAKRQLCNSYDLFIADDRIVPSLPKLIGKSFFKKKKLPIPVNLQTKDWSSQIQKALSGTYLHRNGGNCLSVRVAKNTMSQADCTENIISVVEGAMEHVAKKWSNVQALHLKSVNSVALPVYQTLPAEQNTRIVIDSK